MIGVNVAPTPVLLQRLGELEALQDRLDDERELIAAALSSRGVDVRVTRKRARHGTDGGYYAHRRRWKTPACEPCLRAHSEALTRRRSSTGRSPLEWRQLLKASGMHARQLRSWARRVGLEVPPAGPVPTSTIAAWFAAHPRALELAQQQHAAPPAAA